MTAELQEFFEDNDFIVYVHEEQGVQIAELEDWTKGGVNMIITLNPFNKEEFIKYVDYFDMDEEIDLHRQDERYKKVFRLSQSVKDFEAFEEKLKAVKAKLEEM